MIGGRRLVDYPVAALRNAGAQVVLAVGWPDDSTREALGAMQLEVIADDVAGGGPAAGVLAALDNSPTDLVVVLACDTPLVDPGTITALIKAVHGDGAVGVVDGARQPLIAAYRKAAGRAFQPGGALRAALDRLDLVDVAIEAEAATNVNTPEELERIRRRSTWPGGGDR